MTSKVKKIWVDKEYANQSGKKTMDKSLLGLLSGWIHG